MWCNVGFAETEQSIMEKHKSSLPKCEGINTDWHDCYGVIIIKQPKGKVEYHGEFRNGVLNGKGFITPVSDKTFRFYGNFKNGEMDGIWYLINPNGEILTTVYKEGSRIE